MGRCDETFFLVADALHVAVGRLIIQEYNEVDIAYYMPGQGSLNREQNNDTQHFLCRRVRSILFIHLPTNVVVLVCTTASFLLLLVLH